MNPQDDLKKALECYKQRADGMASLFTGASESINGRHWPFDSYKYTHRAKLAGMTDATYSLLKAPMAPGSRGPESLAAWDTALLMPATAVRGKLPVLTQKLPLLRRVNRTWETTAGQLRRSGPLGKDRSVVRPQGKWIVDLVVDRQGPELFETALALAHLRGEKVPKTTKYPYGGAVARLLPRCVAEVALARRFRLPLDLTDEWIDGAVPGLPCGISVIVDTNNPASPSMLVPAMGKGCPVPDRTLTCVLASVVYQSVPYALSQGLSSPGPLDHWACSPTLVAFAGFEHVDYITQAELTVPYPEYKGIPYYGVPVQDLMPMEDFEHFLRLAGYTNVLKSDATVDWADWNATETKILVDDTPLWPTKEAFHMPTQSSVSPERPGSRVRSKSDLTRPDQARWVAAMDRAFMLVKTAAEREHKLMLGAAGFKELRAARNRGWKYRKTQNSLKRKQIRVIWAERTGRPLSDNQAQLLRDLRKIHGDQFPQYTKMITETTENPYRE